MSNKSDNPTAMPRWVKMFAIATAVIAVVLLVAVITGVGGPHGPGRHLATGVAGAGAVGSEQK
jgi:hypothetical protein